MSYQSCGRITERSDDLGDAFAVGDLVACAGSGFGHHAEFGYAPRNTMARVPDGLSPEAAATNNAGLTALHMLRRARFQAGEVLAVFGLGLVGQFAAQLAAALGGRAVGTDLYALRLETARVAALSAQQAARACADETLDTTALPAAAVAARLAPFLGGSPGGGAQPNRGSRGGSG